MAKYWKKFSMLALDESSLERIYKNIQRMYKGILPDSTPVNFREPTIIQLNNIPNLGNFDVVFYDIGGENFDNVHFSERNVKAVFQAPKVIIILSLAELGPTPQDTAYKLLNTYIVGRSKVNRKTRTQVAIITLTKADLLLR